MINPFEEKSRSINKDNKLVRLATKGDKKALEELVTRHQDWIYNIAFRMTGHPQDAEDVTQEILIKVITRLSTFRGESAFRTWLYRIVSNHVINMKKKSTEKYLISFEKYGKEIDDLPDQMMSDQVASSADLPLLMEETNLGCITGMLICLNRSRRLIFILGSIFGVDDKVGSEILNISRENFRQKLSRGRRQIINFMSERCSLIDNKNSCRCEYKTGTLIDMGLIDPDNLMFGARGLTRVKAVARIKAKRLDDFLESKCDDIFRNDYFRKSPDFINSIRSIINSKEFGDLFKLNN